MHLREVYFRYSEAFRGCFRYLQKQREFVRYLEMKARSFRHEVAKKLIVL